MFKKRNNSTSPNSWGYIDDDDDDDDDDYDDDDYDDDDYDDDDDDDVATDMAPSGRISSILSCWLHLKSVSL